MDRVDSVTVERRRAACSDDLAAANARQHRVRKLAGRPGHEQRIGTTAQSYPLYTPSSTLQPWEATWPRPPQSIN